MKLQSFAVEISYAVHQLSTQLVELSVAAVDRLERRLCFGI
jgi:hypothetical protein